MHRSEDAGAMNEAAVRVFVKEGKAPARKVAAITGGKNTCVPVKLGPIEIEGSATWPSPTEEKVPRICKSNVHTMKPI